MSPPRVGPPPGELEAAGAPGALGGARLPSKWTTFAIVAVGVLMATIDSSIVNVSLPLIARHFGVPLGGMVEWVVIAYVVVVAALLLTAGRIADVLGRRTIWSAGLLLFVVGSALCGAAPRLLALVIFRGIQGIGGALLMAVSPAMLVTAFPARERGRVLGLNAVVVGVGISAGPMLGGAIAWHFGWRWIFYVNVPFGVLGIAASLTFLARDRPAPVRRFDVFGAVLLAVGLSALTGTMSFGSEQQGRWLVPSAGGAIAVAALGGLCLRLARTRDPLVDPRLFRNRVFTSASLSLLLSSIATFAVAFLLPFYLEQLRDWPADRAGLALTPLPLTVAVISPFTGSLADRIGTRQLAAGGMLVATAGLASLAFVERGTPIDRIILSLVVIGVGRAIFQPPNNSALMGAAPRDRQGVAAGVLATARVAGQSLSIALAGAVFALFGGSEAAAALRHGHSLVNSTTAGDAFVRGTRAAFLACAIASFAAALAALVRGREVVADPP